MATNSPATWETSPAIPASPHSRSRNPTSVRTNPAVDRLVGLAALHGESGLVRHGARHAADQGGGTGSALARKLAKGLPAGLRSGWNARKSYQVYLGFDKTERTYMQVP
ncbi:hypothetical protein GCM10023178_25450 [Actinomadura luteofluorescens]